MTQTTVTRAPAPPRPPAPTEMAYIVHPRTGVRRIPAAWVDGWIAGESQFRLATAQEIAAYAITIQYRD